MRYLFLQPYFTVTYTAGNTQMNAKNAQKTLRELGITSMDAFLLFSVQQDLATNCSIRWTTHRSG
jgi:hypothetical protein